MSEVIFSSHNTEALKAFDPVSNRRGWADHIAIEDPAGEHFDGEVSVTKGGF